MERVCQFCGVDITGSHGCRKFCSEACKQANYRRSGKNQASPSAAEEKSRRLTSVVLDVNGDRECPQCGARFTWKSAHPNGGGKPPKYCTLRCRKRMHRVYEMDRGYQSPLKARRACEMCGEAVFARTKTSAAKRCIKCRQIPASEPLPEEHWVWWYGKSSPWVAPIVRPSFVAGTCPRCGTPFVAIRQTFESAYRYCSAMCAKSDSRSRRRARKVSAYVADVRRHDIFVRDDWRCHICNRKVSKVQQAPHPRAATIDHLIPLAKGGTHEPANVATACFKCNCIKSDGAANDQLMLVG